MSLDRSQPSLESFGENEDADADQDHEADRRIGAGKIVAFGKLVDELAKAAEIDQELDAHDIDQRENQPEPHADKDRRQRRRKQIFQDLLGGGRVEASPPLMSTRRVPASPSSVFRIT